MSLCSVAQVQAAGTVTFAGWGGALQDAERKAYLKPAEAALGIKIQEDNMDGLAAVRAQVMSGKPKWDVVELASNDCVMAQEQGLTEPLDEEELQKLGPEPEWGVIPANRLGTTLRKVAGGRFMVRSSYSYDREEPLAEVRKALQGCYQMRYPQMRSHALPLVWGGVTALTRNGALYFGQVGDGLYISIGCNGAGMLKGSMFGKLLGEMACGQQSPQLADALGFERPSWLPPEPLRRIAVVSTIKYQKYKAGIER